MPASILRMDFSIGKAIFLAAVVHPQAQLRAGFVFHFPEIDLAPCAPFRLILRPQYSAHLFQGGNQVVRDAKGPDFSLPLSV